MTKYQLTTLIVISLAVSMIYLDMTIFSVALPAIQKTFDATRDKTQWVVSIYLLFASVFIFAVGRISDMYGHQKAFALGTFVFITASLGCGFSFSIEMLILFRAVQGIGAAFIMTSKMHDNFGVCSMEKKFPDCSNYPMNTAFFLFGARNTGKSTLIKAMYADFSMVIDLLKKKTEARFSRNPDDFYDIVMELPESTTHVIIDEVQKNPKLLDVVHDLMGATKKYFIMTDSSARKLKQGGANLLAGRAFVYHMYPLTHIELGDTFKLDQALKLPCFIS